MLLRRPLLAVYMDLWARVVGPHTEVFVAPVKESMRSCNGN